MKDMVHPLLWMARRPPIVIFKLSPYCLMGEFCRRRLTEDFLSDILIV